MVGGNFDIFRGNTAIEPNFLDWFKQKRDNLFRLSLFVPRAGHDPATSGLWILRSNQLSYLGVPIGLAGANIEHYFSL